jgi:hypothetical protein
MKFTLNFRFLIVGLLPLTTVYCSNNQEYKKPIDKERKAIIENKVKTRTLLKVLLDKNGRSKGQKEVKIDSFNSVGLVIKSTFPIYEKPKTPPTPPGGLTIEQINELISVETTIPTGYSSTSYYEYDENGNQTTIRNFLKEITKGEDNFLFIEEHQNSTIIRYDKYGNWIEKCYSFDIEEDICNYRVYNYDNRGNIISHLDSAGARSGAHAKNRSNRTITYEYDEKRNILFNGDYRRKFNEKNEIAEEIDFPMREDGNIDIYDYNTSGHIICITSRRVVSSTWNPTTNTTIIKKIYTTKKYFYYDEKGLLKQIKEIDESNRLKSIENFTYTFN